MLTSGLRDLSRFGVDFTKQICLLEKSDEMKKRDKIPSQLDIPREVPEAKVDLTADDDVRQMFNTISEL
jgi:hypothetical protein